MIPVSFDISGVVDLYNLSLDEVSGLKTNILDKVVGAFIRNVTSIAQKELFKTRKQYINSVIISEKSESYVVVELVGFLPNAVERGISAFDIKEGFQNSNKAKRKIGGGWYLAVPFRHGNPEAIGESDVFSGVMSKEVYKVAKNLKTRESLTKSRLPMSARGVSSRKAISNGSVFIDEYRHKHSIHEGMRKSQKHNHGQYVTFRRVSDKSDSNSWIHRGIKAHNIFDKAINKANILHEVDMARDEFFYNLGI